MPKSLHQELINKLDQQTTMLEKNLLATNTLLATLVNKTQLPAERLSKANTELVTLNNEISALQKPTTSIEKPRSDEAPMPPPDVWD